jgi:hypothetical protein
MNDELFRPAPGRDSPYIQKKNDSAKLRNQVKTQYKV